MNIPEREDTSFERQILFDVNGIKRAKDFEINDSTYPFDDLGNKNIFLEGVSLYLDIDSNDSDALITEVKKRYSVKGIEFTKTVRQWLQGKEKPSQGRGNRENCYNFCIALDMDINQTFEFMFKYFKVMPFYYKNRIDAIYYYCICHNKNYEEINQMLTLAKTFPVTNDETTDTEGTKNIGKKISEIDDDEEFLDYLKNFCYDDKHRSSTARRIALEYIDKCKKLANVKANSKLLLAMSGYNNQVGINGGRADKGISKSSFHPEFTQSFPDDQTFGKIEKHPEKVSEEALRKSLILLVFYNFYKSRENILGQSKSKESIKASFDDFCEECDQILAECGYVQLYPRNFYDWHIMYFAGSDDPIEILKLMIKEKYTYEMDKQ